MKFSSKVKTKKRLSINTLIIVFIISLAYFLMILYQTSAILSDNIGSEFEVFTGNLSVELDNLKVYNDSSNLTTYFTPNDTNREAGIIMPNESNLFSFDVKNMGLTGISTDIYLNISFDAILREQGILLVYPTNVSDEDIIDDLYNGDDSLAIIKLNADDQTSIVSEAGTFNGIRQKIDTRNLDSADPKRNQRNSNNCRGNTA